LAHHCYKRARVGRASAHKGGERMTDAGMAWPPVRAARGTVLVVDNGRMLTGEIGPALEGAGYRVLAATPLEALGMAHEVQPDVVVLDARGTGHARAAGALARRLRGLGPTALIPLVALATQGRLTAALPVNEVVPPPGAGSEVAARVARWLPAA